MSRATSCHNKRRRHSSEPTPSQVLISDRSLRKKIFHELDSENESMIEGTEKISSTTSPSSVIPQDQMTQQQSLFTDKDVTRLANAVKTIMLDDLRKELKAELQMYVNNITSPLYNEIEKLKLDNFNLKKSMNDIPSINKKIDDLEQHSRTCCIRISGVTQTKDEDTTKLVCDIAGKLNVDLNPNDISVSHRLPTEKGHKQIIARFTHSNKRTELLKASKKIKEVIELKNVGISQYLTKTRGKIAYLAREAVRRGNLKQTSVWDGKIFMTDNNDNKHVVTTESEFHQVVSYSSSTEQHFSASSNQQYPQPNHPSFPIRSPMSTFPPPMMQQHSSYPPGGMYNPQMFQMQQPPRFY
ncbi:unnamed protein product [Mytilus coruscus]|uniref:Uncharacterized protein n=1 Tax=Mytilus coruscus TaxID=42192 RepID=A0A6J8E545_MYTCO|nr:unnamed protein product [Mytilus coruscus]